VLFLSSDLIVYYLLVAGRPSPPPPYPRGLARSSRYLIPAPKNFSFLRISNTRIRSTEITVAVVILRERVQSEDMIVLITFVSQ